MMTSATEMTKPEIVNGINVDELKALVGGVAADPESGATSWRVSTQWQGQTHSRSKVDGFGLAGEHIARPFTIDIDEPCELGGSNRFANPQEHLLAALNACMTVGYVAQCAIRGIELESLEIETTGDIDLRGFLGLDPAVAPGYEALSYTVRIKGNATPAQFEEVHAAVMATSPNFHNISKPIGLDPKLVVG
ncbi:OsmC family protein [Novosphingobium sp. PY1]|nr:OsmC family protein [Novosphingobium sp. PY1]GFM31347.1 OsmC family protein [Novosphingobium sp. PY1]